jgi:hypothetical protein
MIAKSPPDGRTTSQSLSRGTAAASAKISTATNQQTMMMSYAGTQK